MIIRMVLMLIVRDQFHFLLQLLLQEAQFIDFQQYCWHLARPWPSNVLERNVNSLSYTKVTFNAPT